MDVEMRHERRIPTLTGFIDAPDWMSAEAIEAQNQWPCGSCREPTYRAHMGQHWGPRLSVTSKVLQLCRAHHIHQLARCGVRETQSQAQPQATVGSELGGYSPELVSQTKMSGKISSYRISMVVVAIAMVVGLRGLVNHLSQHTRTEGGA